MFWLLITGVPSPKLHARFKLVPPEIIDESLKFIICVKHFPVKLKSGSGKGLTVTVAVPLCIVEQPPEAASCMLTKEYK